MKPILTLLFLLSIVAGASADTVEDMVQQTLSQMTLEEKTRICFAQSKFSSPGVPRLGIPDLWMSDGPHGVRMEINWDNWGHSNWTNDSCTAFPALTCLAATWNPDMARLYGKSIGEEARYRNKAILLGPGVNIFRTPLNGRNFEYMGEDPMLSGSIAAPYIQGLQSNGVACCLKHYALNNQEEYRGHVNVKVSDRALYEIYLPAFKKAVQEGGAWSVMGSYNQYQDIHASHNDVLLNKILKGEWGFKGAVITDWGAAHDTKQAVFNGLDLEMGTYTNGLTSEGRGFTYYDYYLGRPYYEMCRRGEVSDSIINDKAARILRVFFHTVMDMQKGHGRMNTQEHLDAARQIAQEGIVLLKNDKQSLLPLSAERLNAIAVAKAKQTGVSGKPLSLLIVGENATRDLCAGGGSSELKPRTLISPLQGIKERFGKDVEISYAQGYASGRPNYGAPDVIPQKVVDSLRNDAMEKARKADIILYIGGLNKNHYEDSEGGDRRFYNMSYNQDQLISDLVKIQPRTIVVIISGTSIAMPWLNDVPAVIHSSYLGSEGGHALADIISGDVCPSGKTVFTYAKELTDYPSHMMGKIGYPGVRPSELPDEIGKKETSAEMLALGAQLKGVDPKNADINTNIKTRTHDGKGDEVVVYNEDILVGYRWFDTKKKPVTFPFGYGLSYTTFKYGDASASAKEISDGETITFTVKVKNTGSVSGKEVVQLYIGDDKASVLRPKKELKAYAKVALEPGEEKAVTLKINTQDLAFFDEVAHRWVAEPGTFKAYIGASSQDIRAVVPFSLK